MKTIVSLSTDSLLHTPSSKFNMLLSPVESLSPDGVLPCSKCVMFLLTHFRRPNHWSHSGRWGGFKPVLQKARRGLQHVLISRVIDLS